MSEIPGDLRFASSHEWVRVEEDGQIRVGISDHAQDLLGDLVYVELPEVGAEVQREDACAVVESVKAASDVYAPVAGVVTEVNEGLNDAPETVNEAPYGDGWLFVLKVADGEQINELLDPDAYEQTLSEDD